MQLHRLPYAVTCMEHREHGLGLCGEGGEIRGYTEVMRWQQQFCIVLKSLSDIGGVSWSLTFVKRKPGAIQDCARKQEGNYEMVMSISRGLGHVMCQKKRGESFSVEARLRARLATKQFQLSMNYVEARQQLYLGERRG